MAQKKAEQTVSASHIEIYAQNGAGETKCKEKSVKQKKNVQEIVFGGSGGTHAARILHARQTASIFALVLGQFGSYT